MFGACHFYFTVLRLLSGVEILSEDDALKVREWHRVQSPDSWLCSAVSFYSTSRFPLPIAPCPLQSLMSLLYWNSGASCDLFHQRSLEAQHPNTVVVFDLSWVGICE